MKRPWSTGFPGFSPDGRSWHMGNPSLLIGQVTLLNPGFIYSLAASLACSLRSMGPTNTSKPSPLLFTLLLSLLSAPLLIFHFYQSSKTWSFDLCFSNYSIHTMKVIAWLKINSIRLKIDPPNCRNYLKLGFEPKYLSRWTCVRILQR